MGTEKSKMDVLLVNRHLKDLNPMVAGYEKCSPGHRFGPAVRHYVLLHCVLSGKGTYTCRDVTYPVAAGQIFRILPGEETIYEADAKDPWYYCWIGFDGSLSRQMEQLPPVFPASAAVMQIFRLTAEQSEASEYTVASNLFRLYDALFSERKTGLNEYVRKIRNYIDAMYMRKISIEDLAEQLHLNRRYLTRLFHAETGMSIRDYLLNTRMREAAECLRAGVSVGETAERCGYADMFLFSKLFKKQFGISPANWKSHEKRTGEGISE